MIRTDDCVGLACVHGNFLKVTEIVFHPMTPSNFRTAWLTVAMRIVFPVNPWLAKVMACCEKIVGSLAESISENSDGFVPPSDGTTSYSVGQARTSTYLCEHPSFDCERDPRQECRSVAVPRVAQRIIQAVAGRQCRDDRADRGSGHGVHHADQGGPFGL